MNPSRKFFQTHPKGYLMSRVLDVRYSDLEEEKRLCQELLDWAEKTGDCYASAFGHTYFGDYYIGQNDSEQAGPHLMTARSLISAGGPFDDLLLRVYSLLAIYYELQADEQSSVQHYLDAIAIARRLGDIPSECTILNNLAFAFQRHHCYDEAMRHYRDAYSLQMPLKDLPIRPALLSNLVEISLAFGQLQEARRYIEECADAESDLEQRALMRTRNLCLYHAAAGQAAEAQALADRLLEQQALIDANRLSAFENYNTLCQSMIAVGSHHHARRFLELMEHASNGGGLDQLHTLEERRICYALRFEPPESHAEAYRRYYLCFQELRSRSNQVIANTMKTRINLERALQQQELLHTKQEHLRREANLDELTQVYSRRYIEQLIRERAGGTMRCCLGIVMLDVDYFKEYNDFYGHLEGDKVLQAVGACLRENAVEGIYPGRYGGDEFTCVCDNLSPEQVERYVRAVGDSLALRQLPHEKSPCCDRVTISIGYAVESDCDDPHLLRQLADQALYEAKRAGRNGFRRLRPAQEEVRAQ